MAWKKWECEFYSQNENGGRYRINIYKASSPSSSTVDFQCTSEGFTLSMDGGDDGMLAPIKTTSVSFNFIIDDTTSGIIDDLKLAGSQNETEFAVLIERFDINSLSGSTSWRKYWSGIMLGDLSDIQDTSPNRFVKIRAVDGLAKLKYKPFDLSNYAGTRSMINIIKICLSQIPTTNNNSEFTSVDFFYDEFLAHIPFYYNRAMGTTLDDTWKNNTSHDPLSLTKVNTQIFQDQNGKGWSYYKVLEQILTAFQLRLMLTPFKCNYDGDVTADNMERGMPVWFLQPPMVFHGNDNNDPYDSTQRIFYHLKTLDDDTALSYDEDYANTVEFTSASYPAQRIAGGLEGFVPPLLSYKTIFNHDQYGGSVIHLPSFESLELQDSTDNVQTSASPTPMEINLTNRTDGGQQGWTYPSLAQASERIQISGEVYIYPLDYAHYFFLNQSPSITDIGYSSGEEFYNEWYVSLGGGVYWVADLGSTIFPRMGLRIQNTYEVIDGAGGTGSINYWLGSDRFHNLYGSVPWARTNGTAYQTDQYPDNFKGFDGSGSGGMAYDKDNPSTTTYEDTNNVAIWGTDNGSTSTYWYGSTDNLVEQPPEGSGVFVDMNSSNPNDNHWAWFSPAYVDGSFAVVNDNGPSWDSTWWQNALIEYEYYFINAVPFTITTPPIPWSRENDGSGAGESGDYGWNLLNQITLYYGFKRDQVKDASNVVHYVCCKDWQHNKYEYPKNRGIHWGYSLANVKVNILGLSSGENAFDFSYGVWSNGNGSPSDEMIESPEIVIGDSPQFNPYASETNIIQGEYMGEFKIYTEATDSGTGGDLSPEVGSDTRLWRTTAQGTSTTEDMQLHIKRSKQALAHHYQIKQKLNLKFMENNSNVVGGMQIEKSLFSSVFSWSSGDWATNQATGTPAIAFVPTGGTFVAGTGEITLIMEDCVTYSKSNLTNDSYTSQ